jgi:ABC-type lipoprotein export system ATPase subunit
VSLSDIILEAAGIERTYRHGDIAVPVLKDLDLKVRRGEWVACTGHSGSGKSTLLNVLGLLDSADAGSYLLAGHDVGDLDDTARARLRNGLLGFVFQLHNLLPRTSALENVATPLIYRGVGRAAARPPGACAAPSGCAVPARRSRPSTSRTAPITTPVSSRAARCSAWRSPVP